MRLDDEAESRNVEDRRGAGGRRRISHWRRSLDWYRHPCRRAGRLFLRHKSHADPGRRLDRAEWFYSQLQSQQRQMDPRAQPQASVSDQDAVFVRRVLGNTEPHMAADFPDPL